MGSAERLRHAAYIRLLEFMGGHSPRNAQTPTGCTRRPPPPAAGRIGDRHTPQHASSGTSCPALKKLLSANLGETAGGRCSGTSATQHDPLQVEDRAGNARHRKPSTSARSRCSSTTSTQWPTSRAPLLSQAGDAASCAFTALPTGADTRVPDAEYRVILLRRLRLPLPLAPQRCPCGGRLDEYGDHRSACAQVGALARRAGPLERAAARICKEAGARVASHVAPRDLDLDVPAGDGRRIEVVANGLPIWQGAQIAVDATIVRPVRRGWPVPPAGLTTNRASPSTRQSTANPALLQALRCRLVVFCVEVGGRVSCGTLTFLRLLARARARQRARGAQQPLDRPWAQRPI